MIIINYLYIFVFAMIGELLRSKVFQLSKVIRRPQMTPVAPKAAATPKVVEEKKEEVAAEDKDKSKLDKYYTAKSEKVIALLYANHTLEEKKAELEQTTKDCENYNNPEQYTKYAKIQRSLVKMAKFIKTQEAQIKSDFEALPLSGREEYQLLLTGKPEPSAPKVEAVKTQIHQAPQAA